MWEVHVEAVGDNPGKLSGALPGKVGKNHGGIVIYLVNGSERKEVSRVAYVRRHSNNPKVKFRDQLNEEIEKAKHSATVLNEHMPKPGKAGSLA